MGCAASASNTSRVGAGSEKVDHDSLEESDTQIVPSSRISVCTNWTTSTVFKKRGMLCFTTSLISAFKSATRNMFYTATTISV